jgi:hypothetical protein
VREHRLGLALGRTRLRRAERLREVAREPRRHDRLAAACESLQAGAVLTTSPIAVKS